MLHHACQRMSPFAFPITYLTMKPSPQVRMTLISSLQGSPDGTCRTFDR